MVIVLLINRSIIRDPTERAIESGMLIICKNEGRTLSPALTWSRILSAASISDPVGAY